ncbi:MAG: thermonuclease family protein [Propionivibrio sp.]
MLTLRNSTAAAFAAALFLLFASALHAAQRTPQALHGKVIGVADGDTVKVLDDTNTTHTIRLLGIDAPEKAQAFGTRAKHSLSELAYGQTVTVKWRKRDRYGRIVGTLHNRRGDDLNLRQVQRGMAWHYADYQREQLPADRETYAEAEVEARQRRIGLWADPHAEAPWQYRKKKRERS